MESKLCDQKHPERYTITLTDETTGRQIATFEHVPAALIAGIEEDGIKAFGAMSAHACQVDGVMHAIFGTIQKKLSQFLKPAEIQALLEHAIREPMPMPVSSKPVPTDDGEIAL